MIENNAREVAWRKKRLGFLVVSVGLFSDTNLKELPTQISFRRSPYLYQLVIAKEEVGQEPIHQMITKSFCSDEAEITLSYPQGVWGPRPIVMLCLSS